MHSQGQEPWVYGGPGEVPRWGPHDPGWWPLGFWDMFRVKSFAPQQHHAQSPRWREQAQGAPGHRHEGLSCPPHWMSPPNKNSLLQKSSMIAPAHPSLFVTSEPTGPQGRSAGFLVLNPSLAPPPEGTPLSWHGGLAAYVDCRGRAERAPSWHLADTGQM